MCFGVASGAPDVIHGERIPPRWWYGHSYCDTCVLTQRWHNVMRLLWHRDTYRDTWYVSRYVSWYVSRYLSRDTIRISSAQVSRCIVTTLSVRFSMLACHGKVWWSYTKAAFLSSRRHNLPTKVKLPNNQTARNVYCGCNNNAIFSYRDVFTFPNVVVCRPR